MGNKTTSAENQFHSQDRQLLHYLVNSIEDYAIYLLDPAGLVLTWNSGAEKTQGFSGEEAIGKSFERFFPEEDIAAGVPTALLKTVLFTGRTMGEGWRVRKNGERFWAAFLITSTRDENDSVIELTTLTRDLTQRKRFEDDLSAADASLRNERDRLRAVTESSLDALFLCESVRDELGEIQDFEYSYVNDNASKVLKLSRSELVGGRMCEVMTGDLCRTLFKHCKAVVLTGEPYVAEVEVHDSKVDGLWLQFQAVKLGDGVALTGSDVSETKSREIELKKAAEFTLSIFAHSPFATIVVDPEGGILSANTAAERMFWYSKDELVRKRSALTFLCPEELVGRASELSEILHRQVAANFGVLTANLERGLAEEREWKLVRRDGSRFDAQLVMSQLPDDHGNPMGYVLIAYDITERKREQEYITHLAHHDALTGLPTRTLLNDRMMMSIARAERYSNCVGLFVVDLDNFKKVNDQQGHYVGDELLKIVAKRLSGCVRQSDTVARMGGDEFVVLLEDLKSPYDVERIAEKILTSLAADVIIGETLLNPYASIGICVYPNNAGSVEMLLRNADVAMYEAKNSGKNCYRLFDSNLEATAARKRLINHHLAEALERRELELLYQPQVAMKSGLVTGVEALIRWNSKALGLIMPMEFIPLAEESGLIVPIGEWVLREACAVGKRIKEATGRELDVAVNVSPRQFQSADFAGMVRKCFLETGFNPEHLELEITESLLLNESSNALLAIEKLRKYGIRIAIDDFGSGFSSMAYLMKFKVDRLKIDKSFVIDMDRSKVNCAVTVAVVALSKSLEIPVIAEGVESALQRELLLKEGCEAGQGYLFSRPIRYEELLAVLEGSGELMVQ